MLVNYNFFYIFGYNYKSVFFLFKDNLVIKRLVVISSHKKKNIKKKLSKKIIKMKRQETFGHNCNDLLTQPIIFVMKNSYNCGDLVIEF